MSIGAVLLAGLVVLPAGIASADEPGLSPEQTQQLTSKMADLGIDPAKWDGLIWKYSNGVPTDAEPESGVTPISTESYRIGITDYTRLVFPDGSVSLSSLEKPTATIGGKGGATPMSISGCSYSYSAGVAAYGNCKISHTTFAYDFYFRASYYQAAGGAAVTSVNGSDWQINATIDHCTKDALGLISSTQAHIRAYCIFPMGGSSYEWVRLTVSPSSASETASF